LKAVLLVNAIPVELLNAWSKLRVSHEATNTLSDATVGRAVEKTIINLLRHDCFNQFYDKNAVL
jgi:hypothetical protein